MSSIADVLANRAAWHIETTDVRAGLARLPDASVHVCVTSPPYYGLRAYGTEVQDWPDGWRGELGQEPTLALFIAHLVTIFAEVRRVLRDDGTLWLNLGDGYASAPNGNTKPRAEQGNGGGRLDLRGQEHYDARWSRAVDKSHQPGLKPKDLMLVPYRLAIALQEDGWYVRSAIVWAKKACMPESVTDRPTSAHEMIWLLTKKPTYFYDQQAVAEPSEHAGKERTNGEKGGSLGQAIGAGIKPHGNALAERYTIKETRNLRNVWHLGPEQFPDAHFATFVTEIPRRAILAGTSERGCCSACSAPYRRVVERTRRSLPERLNPGHAAMRRALGRDPMKDGITSTGLSWPGWRKAEVPQAHAETLGWAPTCHCVAGEPIGAVVLDPFAGAATTGVVATRLGRRFIGLELNESYCELGRNRIIGDAPLFNTQEVHV